MPSITPSKMTPIQSGTRSKDEKTFRMTRAIKPGTAQRAPLSFCRSGSAGLYRAVSPIFNRQKHGLNPGCSSFGRAAE